MPAQSLPGPTGETNRLNLSPRPALLCLGPGADAAEAQASAVERLGGQALRASGQIAPEALLEAPPYGGVIWWGEAHLARAYEMALAARPGPIIPLITGMPDTAHALVETHLCVDTTASGGNVALLGASAATAS